MINEERERRKAALGNGKKVPQATMKGKGVEDDDSVEDPDDDEPFKVNKNKIATMPSFLPKQSVNSSASNDIISNLQSIMA